MIVYRKDLFEEAGLEPPSSYANVTAALDALHSPPDMYGFVAATKVDENFMSQVLEHVFLANGVSIVNADGIATLEEGPTLEVLDFYKAIAEASPPGELYWEPASLPTLPAQAMPMVRPGVTFATSVSPVMPQPMRPWNSFSTRWEKAT